MFIKKYEEKITIIVRDNEAIADISEQAALDLANKEMYNEGHDVQRFGIEAYHSHYNEVIVEYTR